MAATKIERNGVTLVVRTNSNGLRLELSSRQITRPVVFDYGQCYPRTLVNALEYATRLRWPDPKYDEPDYKEEQSFYLPTLVDEGIGWVKPDLVGLFPNQVRIEFYWGSLPETEQVTIQLRVTEVFKIIREINDFMTC